VDFRTRMDCEVNLTALNVHDFFSCELPAALEKNTSLTGPGIEHFSMKPFSFEVEDELWSLQYTESKATVVAGPIAGAAHARLSNEDFGGLVRDLYSPITFFTGGTLDMVVGSLEDFLDTWLVLRGALDNRAIHTPGAISLIDRQGNPLNLQQSFTLDDDIENISHFIQEAGFLHLKNLFSKEEMQQISDDMDHAAPLYSDGDGKSWWAQTAGSRQRLVRMQSFDEHSLLTVKLLQDERFLFISQITGDHHQHMGLDNNKVEALIKPLNVVKGISDLPWHKDCSLGRHSYDCCSITAGISVTGAGATSGQLRVVAGSHRALMWPALLKPDHITLPEIDLPTSTGDVTLHLSCTMHMAQAPTERERRVMYTGFRLPSRGAVLAKASQDRISAGREGAYTTVSQ
jgi:hypothetical protein